MNRLHQFVGRSDDDRARVESFSIVLPLFPLTGECKWLMIVAVNMESLFTVFTFLPLKKSVRWYQTAPKLESGTK
jgi:hypothetical protein